MGYFHQNPGNLSIKEKPSLQIVWHEKEFLGAPRQSWCYCTACHERRVWRGYWLFKAKGVTEATSSTGTGPTKPNQGNLEAMKQQWAKLTLPDQGSNSSCNCIWASHHHQMFISSHCRGSKMLIRKLQHSAQHIPPPRADGFPLQLTPRGDTALHRVPYISRISGRDLTHSVLLRKVFGEKAELYHVQYLLLSPFWFACLLLEGLMQW